MALLTAYSSSNMIVLQGKTQRITCGAPLDPVITIDADLSDKTAVGSVTVKTFFEMICHSTASFAYVGMDYDTAALCRDAMISKFTRTKSCWKFKEELSGKHYTVGWVQEGSGTVQEAEVLLQPMGGHMYQVVVNVDCEDVVYTETPGSVTFPYPSCMGDLK